CMECMLGVKLLQLIYFFFSSRRRHTRCLSDWSSDVCSSDLSSRPSPEPLERRSRPAAGGCRNSSGGASSARPTCDARSVLGCAEIGRASCRERVESAVGGEVV